LPGGDTFPLFGLEAATSWACSAGWDVTAGGMFRRVTGPGRLGLSLFGYDPGKEIRTLLPPLFLGRRIAP